MLFEKTAIVTGAASGIGYAVAQALRQEGAQVVMADVNEALLIESARELGGVPFVGNLTRREDCRRLVETAVARFGGIDILVCNAGISMRALFDNVQLDVLRRLMDVNFWGTVYCTKYALPYLQAARGTVVGVSSVAGLHGLPGRTGYSASKYAMTGFLDTVRIENAAKGYTSWWPAPDSRRPTCASLP